MEICKIEDCNNKCKAIGLCGKHYEQNRKFGKIIKRTTHDKNEIIFKEDIAEIVLYNRKCQEVARAIIDSEDVEKIKKYKWNLDSSGYVSTGSFGKWLRIQHVILEVAPSRKKVIDHKNGNRLINKKSNLRICTNTQNGFNRKKHKNNTSGYKGIHFRKDSKKWRAIISANKKIINLGSFIEKSDAIKAYNKASLKYHGEFVYLNGSI